MPVDSFNNARPYFDVTFPSSGDGFSIAGFRNVHAGLGFLDMIPLQPRAHNPQDLKIMVRGQDASQYYNPVYFGNADQRIPFGSGDTPNFSVPSSNPRIDIVYITPSGDIKVQAGTEAVNPTLPSLGPSGDSRFPVAAIWCKVGMSKIVNFEDKDSNSGDGYIYKDLRAWMRSPTAGAAPLTSTIPTGITGDNSVGIAGSASRADHHHQGVHTVKVIGSGDLFGDVELASNPNVNLTQQGNRITINVTPASQASMEAAIDNTKTVTPLSVNWHPGVAKAWGVFNGTGTPAFTASYNFDASITDNGTADYTLSLTTDMSSANYGVVLTPIANGSANTSIACLYDSSPLTAGTIRVITARHDNTQLDLSLISIAVYGDQ